MGALDREFETLGSVPLILEYEAVLKRPEHLAAIGSTTREIDLLLKTLVSVITPVPIRFLWRPVMSDSDDEMVLETAVNGSAEFLVTFNRRHFDKVAARFGIRVSSPREAVKEIWKDAKK